ncbi:MULTISPECIES: TraR/DksA family transcriptional regulator [Pseudomonas]|jgi:DnaK suppressor protein|nr:MULTISPECIES: TraR/DksA family transcriptional regulator [Pseudomonas]EQL43994.1 conjugal transfer protein TraR [Pseudomonas aeruginosa VRFPA03]MCP8472925.1 TraR/DksA family transcriptional regulator [Pseudomonas triclosanedens]MCP8479495.1 TraR/DksA family transcriptional regulator [Pseudomonas triclosanedens]WQN30388.1 TraR/DksA family transcriptional regulator [Stutzerimonas stutzeri]AGL46452.1 TraR/DksA family transcriptional regulator [Pseudomonas aeruginosa PA96]
MSTLLTQQQLLSAPESDYMSDQQLAFFKELLLNRKLHLQGLLAQRAEAFRDDSEARLPDAADTASAEEQRAMEMRMLKRDQAELLDVEAALKRIEEGDYGYCAEFGQPIGLKRLLVAPTASLCIDAQEIQERRAQRQRVA